MKKEKKSREEIIDEWLNLYPKTVLEFETNESGQIVVMVPHSENWFTKKFLPKPKSPAAKIKLDEFGSFIWQKCDGTITVREISAILAAEYGDKVMPADERTVMFVQQMYNENFISVFKQTTDEQ